MLSPHSTDYTLGPTPYSHILSISRLRSLRNAIKGHPDTPLVQPGRLLSSTFPLCEPPNPMSIRSTNALQFHSTYILSPLTNMQFISLSLLVLALHLASTAAAPVPSPHEHHQLSSLIESTFKHEHKSPSNGEAMSSEHHDGHRKRSNLARRGDGHHHYHPRVDKRSVPVHIHGTHMKTVAPTTEPEHNGHGPVEDTVASEPPASTTS